MEDLAGTLDLPLCCVARMTSSRDDNLPPDVTSHVARSVVTLLDKVISEGLAWRELAPLARLLTCADVNQRDEDGACVLHALVTMTTNMAAALPKQVVRSLATPHNINCKRRRRDSGGCSRRRRRGGESALHLAASHNHNIITDLVELGADIEAVTSQGMTPLHLAVTSLLAADPAADPSRRLGPLVSPATINKRSRTGQTPLHLAAQTARHDVITFLLGRGASVQATDKHGCTPVVYCCGSYLPSTRTIDLLWPSDPIQLYLCLIFQLGYDISSRRLEVINHIIARLTPISIRSVALVTLFDPPLVHVNGVVTNLLLGGATAATTVRLLCHLLAATGTTHNAKVRLVGDGYGGEHLRRLEKQINSVKPLTRLAGMELRLAVMSNGGCVEGLRLPPALLAYVDLHSLGGELQQIWRDSLVQ